MKDHRVHLSELFEDILFKRKKSNNNLFSILRVKSKSFDITDQSRPASGTRLSPIERVNIIR
jgi:hypothetical protein